MCSIKTNDHAIKSSPPCQESGFTLIELAIVIIISSIMLIPLLQLYNISKQNEKLDATKEIIKNAASYIGTSVAKTGNYPCPASRSVGVGNPNYGVDYCSISAANRAALTALATGTCIAGNGICKILGSADRDGNGTNDPILIGAVPFATLANTFGTRIGADDVMLDAWGNVISYAISQNLTTLSLPALNRVDLSQDYRLGVIDAVDEFGNPTAGINNQDAQFVLVSHGRDGRGAFTRYGVQSLACSAVSQDRENCDNDNVFMSSIGAYEGTAANYFDDIVYFQKNTTGDLWKYLTNATTGSTTASIQNLNTANVGVGTNTPLTKLDVNGNIRVPTFAANMLCKPDATATGQKCMPIDFLWGGVVYGGLWSAPTSIPTPSGATTFKNLCPDAKDAITGISLGKVQCSNVNLATSSTTPAANPVQCDAGAYLSGILTNGCIICSSGTIQKCP